MATTKSRTTARLSAKSDRRRAEIIEAASSAFMLKGYAATSIDDIARLLGCTKGLIYYHFKNKSELFFAVHRYTIDINLSEAIPIANSEKPASERLRLMVISRIDSIIDYLPYQRVTLMGLEMQIVGTNTLEEQTMLNELLTTYDEYENLFVKVISEGIRQGEFIPGDARMITKPLLGAINWMIMWYRPRPNATKKDRQKLCQTMVDYVMRGVGTTQSKQL